MDVSDVERLQERGNVAKLRKAVTNRDHEVRRAAVIALGKLEDVGSVPAVSDRLVSDDDAYVRSAAARALGRLHDSRAVPRLIWSLQNDADTFVSACAAEALGRIGDESAVPALIQAAAPPRKGGSTDVTVRTDAVKALGRFSHPDALAALGRASTENVLATSRAAKQALVPEIVGESFCQDALRRIFEAGQATPTGVRVTAWLYPEPTNSHDPNAVCVAVESERIGYLRRDAAARYSAWLQRRGPLSCTVEIGGSPPRLGASFVEPLPPPES